MALGAVMQTAMSGVSAAELAIAVYSNNLANANTDGFKQSRPVFGDQRPRTQGRGAAPTDASGGSNPVQVGSGVQTVGVETDFSPGSISTGGDLDTLALEGDAFFILQGENLYAEGLNSGLAMEQSSGENGAATIVAGAIEQSNTDIGENLVDLYSAETQFRANLQVVDVAATLLDELMHLRRN